MCRVNKLKTFTVLFITLSVLLTFTVSAFAEFESPAGSAVLMETSTGEFLYEKNADKAVPPASITKLMTLLLGFEAMEKGDATWDDLVPISEKAWKMGGSRMFLEVGHEVKYGDIMTGISVVSANDGCIALAEYLYGSESAFVKAMNNRAKELGLTNTHFVNSNGLPAEGHVMSARDIAVLARYIIEKYPKILELESQKEFTFSNIHQYNRNPLLGVFPGADGLKTGWTEEAGYCLVGTAKQEDMRMISVVLNTADENERLAASQELLNYGFKDFEIIEAIKQDEVVDNIEVNKGKVSTTPVKIDDSISIIIPSARKDDLEFIPVKNVEVLDAPVLPGVLVGKLEVRLDGKVLGESSISTVEEVQKLGFFKLLFGSIWSFFQSIFS